MSFSIAGSTLHKKNDKRKNNRRRPPTTNVPNAMSILGTTVSMLATVVDVPMLNDMDKKAVDIIVAEGLSSVIDVGCLRV